MWSDEWTAYNRLNAHRTINHSQHYVDLATGVHTNNIEAHWSACKTSFKRRFSVAHEHLPAYLDEYMWRSCQHRAYIFSAIVDAICLQYPV